MVGRSRAFSVGSEPCPLLSEISSDSLILLTILWSLDGEISKVLAVAH